MKRALPILLKIFLGLIILITSLTMITPWVLSTSFGKDFILKVVNHRIPGAIYIDELKLSWFGFQEIHGLSLFDTQDKEVIHITEINADASLFTLLSHPLTAKSLRVTGLKGMIVQDGQGRTNLENALGLKPFDPKNLKTPVYIENVNLEAKTLSDHSINLKAVGLTQQNNLKGQLTFDGTLGNTIALNLKAEGFPVLVLDQTLAISKPALSGFLLNLLGDYIDIRAEEQGNGRDHTFQILAKSPSLSTDISGQFSHNTIFIKEGGRIAFSLPINQSNELLKILNLDQLLKLETNLTGTARLHPLQLDFHDQELENLVGSGVFEINETTIRLDESISPIEITAFNFSFDAPLNLNKLSLVTSGSGYQQNIPLSFDLKVDLSKKDLIKNNVESLFQQGIAVDGKLDSQNLKSTVLGTIKEKNTALNLTFDHSLVEIPMMYLQIDHLPIHEWVQNNELTSDLEGSVVLKNPRIKQVNLESLTAFEEFTIPWTIDPSANSIRVAFTGLRDSIRPNDKVKGTLRIEDWMRDGKLNLKDGQVQLDMDLQNFQTDLLQSILPNHNITAVLGPVTDATINAKRDEQGMMKGQITINAPRYSDAFLKYFESKFSLSENLRDITFEASTSQAVGSMQLVGSFLDIIDKQGNLTVDTATVSMHGQFRHFPIGLMTKLATGNNKLAEKMEAILGSQVNAEIDAEIAEKKGQLSANIKGLNGQVNFNGFIDAGVLYLKEPMTASLKVTPQLEHAVLREVLPILGSVISSDQPIELKIAKEGFRFPLQSPSLVDLDINHGEVILNKMKFSRDGQLGQIVSILGINANPFEVWFTPIYFSIDKGLLSLQRSDMLIANSYPLANWGTVNFKNDQLNLMIGLSSLAIKKAFKVKNIKNSYMLILPIRGTTNRPQIDTAQVTARISALIAQGNIQKGNLIGSVLDAASDFLSKDEVPPPTTNPLPWQNSIEDSDTAASNENIETSEKPFQELKKNAKSILKGILGK